MERTDIGDEFCNRMRNDHFTKDKLEFGSDNMHNTHSNPFVEKGQLSLNGKKIKKVSLLHVKLYIDGRV